MGPVSENGFRENSVDSQLKETLGFRFQKANSDELRVSVTVATYSVKLTCQQAGCLQLTQSFSSSLAEAYRLKKVSDMACPFLEEPVDIEAQILRRVM